MKKLKNTITLLFLFILHISCQNKFDKKIWLEQKNNKLTTFDNPRLQMVRDVISNHLHIGMHKDSIIAVLGKPYQDKEKFYIPKGIKQPDSLRKIILIKDKKKRDLYFGYLNKWYKENSIKGHFLIYPIGWDIIDPIFLEWFIHESKSDSK